MATARVDLTKNTWVSAATADVSIQNRSGNVIYIIEKGSAPTQSDINNAFIVKAGEVIVLVDIADTVYAYATSSNAFIISS